METDPNIHKASIWVVFIDQGLVGDSNGINSKLGYSFAMISLILGKIGDSHVSISDRFDFESANCWNDARKKES